MKRNKTSHPRFHTLLGEITIVSHAVTAPENPGGRLHRAAATALSLQMPCFSTSGAMRSSDLKIGSLYFFAVVKNSFFEILKDMKIGLLNLKNLKDI